MIVGYKTYNGIKNFSDRKFGTLVNNFHFRGAMKFLQERVVQASNLRKTERLNV